MYQDMPGFDLTNFSFSNDLLSKAILTIPDAERYGEKAEFMEAFRLAHGGMVVLMQITGLPRLIRMSCAPGHPEEFGELAIAIAKLVMSG